MMFGLMRQVLGEMQARGAGAEEYEALVRAAPALNGAGTLADVLGDAGTRAQALAMAGLDPEIFTPALEGRAIEPVELDKALACPTLVLRADAAQASAAFTTADADAFLATNPHATVTMVEGASHLLHDEQPERFIAEVQRFLAALA